MNIYIIGIIFILGFYWIFGKLKFKQNLNLKLEPNWIWKWNKKIGKIKTEKNEELLPTLGLNPWPAQSPPRSSQAARPKWRHKNALVACVNDSGPRSSAMSPILNACNIFSSATNAEPKLHKSGGGNWPGISAIFAGLLGFGFACGYMTQASPRWATRRTLAPGSMVANREKRQRELASCVFKRSSALRFANPASPLCDHSDYKSRAPQPPRPPNPWRHAQPGSRHGRSWDKHHRPGNSPALPFSAPDRAVVRRGWMVELFLGSAISIDHRSCG
jgi:hypothetical protein